MAQAAGPFDPILSPLDGVMARRRLRALIRAALACALAVLAALLAVMLAERLGAGPFGRVPILVAVGLAAALCSAIIARMRRRSPVAEAFFIDRVGGFDEAYGTAVELVDTPGAESEPVPAQLLAAVRARAGTIAVAPLVRILTPGFLAALALMLALVAAVWWLDRVPAPIPVDPASETAVPAEPAGAETLASVVEMLAEDAGRRDDPLLEAIARTLSERVASAGGEPMSDALQRQINDLLDQAAAAYGEDAPRWLGTSQSMRLSELEDALAAMQAAHTAAPSATPLDPFRPQVNDIQATEGPEMYGARPELAERYADRTSDEISGGAEAAALGEAASDLEGGAPSRGPQLMQPEQLQSIGAIPVGAALDSGRGASNAAGLGQEDLRADDAFARLDAPPAEDMVVSAEPQAEGSRIRIEIVPELAEGGVAGAANAIGGQTGTGSSEPVARDFIPATARDIAARYFERAAQ